VSPNNDLNIGYQAGQQDSDAVKLLAKIVRLDAIAEETTEFDDFHAVTLAIKSAREWLEKRGML
jgi:hypothetical protein